MTTLDAVKPSDRVALPRSLVGRSAYPEYIWTFDLGDKVRLHETQELAVVVGRSQILGELDNFLVQVIGDSAAPLWLKDFQLISLDPAA